MTLKTVSTRNVNYQFPTLAKCVVSEHGVANEMSDYFAIKTNKYVTLNNTQDLVFDVQGVWLENSVLRGLFSALPMYLKDYHEDDDGVPVDVEESC